MFCNKCGSEIADGGQFCPKCGARADDMPSVPGSVKPRKEYKSILYAILVFFPCVLFAANDFYAGYKKIAIIRTALGLGGFFTAFFSGLAGIILISITALWGMIEIFLEYSDVEISLNGRTVCFVQKLSLLYDKKGVQEYIRQEYDINIML